MGNQVFHFKQFSIQQDQCAMKVGTDGVLLGAWALVEGATRVLDIGTGTGLLALMVAQRNSLAQIDAIEIDEAAANQAGENFHHSPWKERLSALHTSLQKYHSEKQYDLIICNPPYFENSLKPDVIQRSMARHTERLPFPELLEHTARLLSPQGRFSLIAPFDREASTLSLAAEVQLYPNRILRVRGTKDTPFKRTLIEFSNECAVRAEDELVIETSRHRYTQDYINLTRPFYLNM